MGKKRDRTVKGGKKIEETDNFLEVIAFFPPHLSFTLSLYLPVFLLDLMAGIISQLFNRAIFSLE